jgi:hypothetical protein
VVTTVGGIPREIWPDLVAATKAGIFVKVLFEELPFAGDPNDPHQMSDVALTTAENLYQGRMKVLTSAPSAEPIPWKEILVQALDLAVQLEDAP